MQRIRDVGVHSLLLFSRLFILQELPLNPDPAPHCRVGTSPVAQLVRCPPRQEREGILTVPLVGAER